jgi:sugar-specific transcriptional regulator TrmB
MTIKQALQQIGIKDKKAEVYLACLELGKATAYYIAKKTGIKRPTCYDIISQLAKEGLLYKIIKKNAVYYSPTDPQVLLDKAREREENIKAIMPQLQNFYIATKIKSSIKYFEGEEGIKEAFNDTLNLKKGEEILVYLGESVFKYLPEFTADYVRRRVEKGIRVRGFYKKSQYMAEYLQRNQEQLREAKVLDEKDFPITNEVNIYQNKVIIASYQKEMFAIIIESDEIAQSQRAIFELAWRVV